MSDQDQQQGAIPNNPNVSPAAMQGTATFGGDVSPQPPPGGALPVDQGMGGGAPTSNPVTPAEQGQQQFGGQDQESKVKAYISGQGAMPKNQYDQLRQQIKDSGVTDENDITAHAIATGGSAALQATRQHFNALSGATQKAVADGNYDLAASDGNRAATFIPDGTKAMFTANKDNFTATVHTPDGDAQHYNLTPEQYNGIWEGKNGFFDHLTGKGVGQTLQQIVQPSGEFGGPPAAAPTTEGYNPSFPGNQKPTPSAPGPNQAPVVGGNPGANANPQQTDINATLSRPGGPVTKQGTTPAAAPAGVEGQNAAYDKMFGNSVLAGHWNDFVTAAKKYNVDPNIVAAVSAHETGMGRSSAVNTRNNPGGVMGGGPNNTIIQQFPSIEAGIDATARAVARNYQRGGHTIEGMAKSYAPPGAANDPRNLNSSWPAGVNKFLTQLENSSSGGGGEPSNGGNQGVNVTYGNRGTTTVFPGNGGETRIGNAIFPAGTPPDVLFRARQAQNATAPGNIAPDRQKVVQEMHPGDQSAQAREYSNLQGNQDKQAGAERIAQIRGPETANARGSYALQVAEARAQQMSQHPQADMAGQGRNAVKVLSEIRQMNPNISPVDLDNELRHRGINPTNILKPFAPEEAGAPQAQSQGMQPSKVAQPQPTQQQGAEPTATNQQTGEKMVYRGGQWIPAQ